MKQKNIFRFADIGGGLHEGTIQEIKKYFQAFLLQQYFLSEKSLFL